MEKKVLLAVDGSPASRLAVDYLALMEAAVVRDLYVTALHVLEAVPPTVLEAADQGGAFWLGHVCDRMLAACDEAAVWVVG